MPTTSRSQAERCRRAAEAAGGRFQFNAEIVAIRKTAAGRVAGVTLKDGSEIDGPVVVNVAGAFALGWFVAGAERTASHPLVAPFVAVGFLGSFTTFSAFTVEAVEGVRAGNGVGTIVFVVGSMALGLLAAAIGLAIGRAI